MVSQNPALAEALPWSGEYGHPAGPEFDPLPYAGLGEMLRAAARQYSAQPAYSICLPDGMSAGLDYGRVESLSEQFAACLQLELGLAAGERVGIQMPNCLAYPVVTFGTLKAGCAVVNVNPLYTAREMNHQLIDSGAKVLVIIDMFADKLPAALAGTQVRHVIRVSVAEFFGWPRGTLIRTLLRLKGQLPRAAVQTLGLSQALALGRRQLQAGRLSVEESPDRLAVLQYTGGTTGVAKGAELTHANLMANIAQLDRLCGPVIRRGEDVALTALPLYHIFAFTFNMLFFYRAGGHNVLSPSPRPVANLRPAFEKFAITKTSGVNTLFKGLLESDWFRNNPPRALDLTISGGTALHSAVAQRWQEVTGTPILEGYGLSETSPVLAVNPPLGENRLGTIGIPLPGTELRVVSVDGEPLPPGEPGDLIARGPQVMRGYANRPAETEAVLRDGWFYTGDVAVMDERGYFRIVDRKKDMIDVSGFNVFPNEVEDVLATHPGIAETAVIGIPNPGGGERVRAYVVPSDPALTPEAVVRFAREQLTAYKVPKEVIFRSELPKTPVGKILRKDLRAQALEEGERQA